VACTPPAVAYPDEVEAEVEEEREWSAKLPTEAAGRGRERGRRKRIEGEIKGGLTTVRFRSDG
jgi:hypothetical protein